jgi:GNAT superfamily N-acetyltransferase
MDRKIVRASIADAIEILNLQKLAYQTEAILYEDWTLPPLMQTPAEIQEEFAKSVFLAAYRGAQIIGSVRALLEADTCKIGRLMVHPDYRRKGTGTLLMKSIEASFPDAKRFELFTGTKSIDNVGLYTKLGYREYHQQDISPKVRLVFMEKIP